MFMLTYNLHNLCYFLCKYCRSVNICDKCTSPKHLTAHPFQSKLPPTSQYRAEPTFLHFVKSVSRTQQCQMKLPFAVGSNTNKLPGIHSKGCK